MAEQPMTRRQRRDAERAAERKRAAEAELSAADDPAACTSPLPARASQPSATSAPSHESTYPIMVQRRSRMGTVGRASVLAVLALVTVVAPLQSNVLAGPQAAAALGGGVSAAAPTGTATTTDPSSSVAAAVLGSDADVDADTDSDLSNVPDAATLARIREAYENASATCAAQTTGASGDTAAFTTTPELFSPMVPGTYTVSSAYGYRLHPTLGYMKLHAGQDYAASVGTPIYAVAAGTVVTAGMVDGTGTVTIEHEIDGETWYTSYLHMYEDGIYVSEGDVVQAGQLIAGVGSTGRSTGAHLHFEVRTANDVEDSSTVDPEKWLAEHGAVELTTDCS
ncbi:M23 family metallopeptidase [Actinomyces sp. MRS3W]|uniref:M23 family metallopeptidase n=1 Tax=Actinomyces sp. MRS3W TaxID=2800796 RepID=UPI0028FD7E1E|nr:M23 family metallopeptidase [Actinomyces sp. MRS3W]MDU0349692.1 M23 family metallopeptidase [Actinomyces sp. MRS3W]